MLDTIVQETSATTISFREALNVLDKVVKDFTYKTFVPSLNEEIVFNEINTGQQKRLLQAVVDSPFYHSKFIVAIYEILKENSSMGKEFDDLTIIDKQVILLKTRIECFNQNYEATTDANVISKDVNLNGLYNNAKHLKPIKLTDTITIKDNPIKIYVAVPTIKTEYQLEKELHNNVDVLEVTDTTSLRKTLGDIFACEIAKYIQKLEIGDKTIDFAHLKFVDRIEILEKLPNILTQRIIQYIDRIKTVLDNIVTVSLTEKETKKEIKYTIPMDASFYAVK